MLFVEDENNDDEKDEQRTRPVASEVPPPPSCPRQIQKEIIRKKFKCSFVYQNKDGQI